MLSSPRLLALYEECLEVVVRMELRGIFIDEDQCKCMIEKILKSMSQIEQEAYKLSGMPFNLGSSADTAKVGKFLRTASFELEAKKFFSVDVIF